MEEQRLVEKYEKDSSFKQEVDLSFQKYNKLVQEALYSNLECVPENILEKYQKHEVDLFFYYGYLQPTSKEQYQKLILYFVKTFNPKPYKPYILVFFNNHTSTNSIYNDFRNLFLLLTIDHFVWLQEFIVVKSSFMHRAMDLITFGTINKYVKHKTVFVNNSKQLCQRLDIDLHIFMEFIPQVIFNDEKNDMPKMSIKQQRINIEGQKMTRQQKQDSNKFFSEMNTLIMKSPGKETHTIQNYELSPIGIPLVLDLLVYYFKSNPNGLLEEGLFRKSVSIDEENQTLTELSNKNYDCLQQVTNPHIIANLIKRFFANLKIPVIPFQQFTQLMHDQGVADKVQHLKKAIGSLSQVHFLSLAYLIQFLKDQVIPRESSNKMTAQNISICFAPCLMRAEKVSTADLIYASKSVIYAKLMITQFHSVFGDEKKILSLFRESYIEHKKSFHDTVQMILEDSPNKNDKKELEKNEPITSIQPQKRSIKQFFKQRDQEKQEGLVEGQKTNKAVQQKYGIWSNILERCSDLAEETTEIMLPSQQQQIGIPKIPKRHLTPRKMNEIPQSVIKSKSSQVPKYRSQILQDDGDQE